MRVGIIAPAWLPVPAPAYGGTEAVLDTLATGLQAAGHSVLLVCHPDSTCPVPKASVVPAEDTTRMGRAAIELEHAIGAYERVRDCDVVHDHTLAGPVYCARFPDLPVVATNHMPFTRTRNAIFGAAAPHVAVVAISHAHAATAPFALAGVVHHGVDVDDFPFGRDPSASVCVLSRMAPDKGIDHAIDIAREAGMGLRIAAKMREQHEREYFEAVIQPKLGGDVVYLGELDATDKRLLLADSAALLNPIMWPEPFGMAMVEALACGTPVVGCAVGAAPEIVEHGVTGFLGRSDDDLVAGLEQLSSIDRGACRRRVEEHFSAERMVAGYTAIYEARRSRSAQAAAGSR
jgi:glycosyltransferase involved in cell wall biosynthesis